MRLGHKVSVQEAKQGSVRKNAFFIEAVTYGAIANISYMAEIILREGAKATEIRI